jgi:hypothetical protein
VHYHRNVIGATLSDLQHDAIWLVALMLFAINVRGVALPLHAGLAAHD